MDILQFESKVQSEYGLNPEYSHESYDGGIKISLQVGDLKWIAVGYNEADANQSVIDKACKYFSW